MRPARSRSAPIQAPAGEATTPGGPDDGAGGDALLAACRRALACSRCTGVPVSTCTPMPLERDARDRAELLREGRQHARPGLDQHHPRRSGVDPAEIPRHGVAGEFGHGAGQLDAGRAAADDDEGEQAAALLGIGRDLGALEGEQQPAADVGRVLDGLEARARRPPTRRGRNRSASRRSPAPARRRGCAGSSSLDHARRACRCR